MSSNNQSKIMNTVWGGLNEKFTPLISFRSIVDEDMGLIKNIIINYRDDNYFNLNITKNYFHILGDLYKRKYINPLYYLMKDEKDKEFLDQCYSEFMTDKEDEVLQYSITSDIYNLVRDYNNSGEIIPTILYYSEAQKKVIDNDPLLSKIKSISVEELKKSESKRNSFGQFYFRTTEEADIFLHLKHKTFYFSTMSINLNEANDDIKFDNEFVIKIYTNGSKINLFDMYRTDIIGGYN